MKIIKILIGIFYLGNQIIAYACYIIISHIKYVVRTNGGIYLPRVLLIGPTNLPLALCIL